MSKLWTKPETALTEAQKSYIAQEWQAKFDKLPWRYSSDDARLTSKLVDAPSQEATSPTISQTQTTTDDSTLALLQKMEQMQSQINELQKWTSNQFEDAKKHYDWPRMFSYKIWGWLPVLSYETFKKDATKWLTFVNWWRLESNHWLRLKLYDFDTREIVEQEAECTHFNREFLRSEKQFCDLNERTEVKKVVEVINGRPQEVPKSVKVKGYNFTIPDNWYEHKFEVLEKAIN